MIKNKFPPEDQIWQLVMVILPFVLLQSLGKTLFKNNEYSFIFALVFGAIGGVVGFLGYYFTQNKSRIVKVITLSGIAAACVLLIILLV